MSQRRTTVVLPWLLSAPAALLLLALFVGPLLLLVRVSLYESATGGNGFYSPGTWSVRGYTELVGERFGRGVLVFTVLLGVSTAVLSVVVGYPLALFIHSLPRRTKRLALGAVILPKLANVFVVLYGLNLVLGFSGPVNRGMLLLGITSEPLMLTHNLFGVLVAEVYLVVPYAVLVLVPVFDRIDPQLVAAARGLGASPWGAFRRVTLPLSLPGVTVAGQLCLIWALGAFVGPLLVGGPEQTTLAVRVQKHGLEYTDWPRAAATAVLTLLTVGVCVAAYAVPARAMRAAGRTGGA